MAKLTLTPQQQAVVENRGGSLLVSAAAGSGKTKVLVDRQLPGMRQIRSRLRKECRPVIQFPVSYRLICLFFQLLGLLQDILDGSYV